MTQSDVLVNLFQWADVIDEVKRRNAVAFVDYLLASIQEGRGWLFLGRTTTEIYDAWKKETEHEQRCAN